MSTMPTDDATFYASLAAFLDDESAGLPEASVMAAASPTIAVFERAVAEAAGGNHTQCGIDLRDRGIVLQVMGRDNVVTVQTIPTGVNVNCVLEALNLDDEVIGMRPIGWEKLDSDDEPATSAAGVTVTSEAPGLAVSWTPDAPNVTPEPVTVVEVRPLTAAVLALAGLAGYRLVRRAFR